MLRLGLAGTYATVVGPEHTADALGNPGVHVLGTPMLAHFCGLAAVAALAGALDPAETTVPARNTAEHLAAAPLGASVVARAELTAIEGRELTFAVEAREGDRVLFAGTHARRVVDRGAFLASLDGA